MYSPSRYQRLPPVPLFVNPALTYEQAIPLQILQSQTPAKIPLFVPENLQQSKEQDQQTVQPKPKISHSLFTQTEKPNPSIQNQPDVSMHQNQIFQNSPIQQLSNSKQELPLQYRTQNVQILSDSYASPPTALAENSDMSAYYWTNKVSDLQQQKQTSQLLHQENSQPITSHQVESGLGQTQHYKIGQQLPQQNFQTSDNKVQTSNNRKTHTQNEKKLPKRPLIRTEQGGVADPIAALLAMVPTAKVVTPSSVLYDDYSGNDDEEYRQSRMCYNCSGTDHTIKNCPKPLFCVHCSHWGHTSNVCFKKQNDDKKPVGEIGDAKMDKPEAEKESKFKVGCYNCGSFEHIAKDCLERLFCTVCKKYEHTANMCKCCHNCGGHHLVKECTLPRVCKLCGKRGHTYNRCNEEKNPTAQTTETTKESQENLTSKDSENNDNKNNEVVEILKSLDMSDFIEMFSSYTLDSMRKLTKDDYGKLGVPLGFRDKLLDAVKKI